MLIIPGTDRIRSRIPPVTPDGYDAFLWHHKRVKVRRSWVREGLVWQPTVQLATAFVNGAGNKTDASSTTATVQRTGIVAGNLIHVAVKCEGAPTISGGAALTCTVSDGTTALTLDATGKQSHVNGDLNAFMFSLMSSVASGTLIYTATFNEARPFKQMVIGQFSYSGTASRQTAAYSALSATDNGTDPVASDPISPTGSDLIVVGSYFNYATATSASHLINGNAAEGTFGNSDGAICWYDLLGAGFTNGTASVDFNTTNDGLVSIVAYEITVAAGDPEGSLAQGKLIGGGILLKGVLAP